MNIENDEIIKITIFKYRVSNMNPSTKRHVNKIWTDLIFGRCSQPFRPDRDKFKLRSTAIISNDFTLFTTATFHPFFASNSNSRFPPILFYTHPAPGVRETRDFTIL